jgi:3-hydroxybutyryl-CoA dehydrogenase
VVAELKRVTVVGAGTMGSQIALQTALSARYDVALVDSSESQLDRARTQNQKLIARSVERGRVDEKKGKAALDRITASADLERAARDADLVIEAVFEDLETKREMFKRVDAVAPKHTILASNSSTIAISRLAEVTGRPDRCCNMHFFHPVTVMQLCEVVRGPQTSDATVDTAMEFVRSIGRIPVLINKEVWGFIVNRILFAASEEALRLYEGGYATFEDIDTAVKKGLNWPMGPFELMDFSGLDIYVGAMEDRRNLGEGSAPPKVLKEKVAAGELGRKSGKGFYEYGDSKG